MKRYFSWLILISLVFVISCSGGSSANFDGLYTFDDQTWKSEMEKMNPNFSQSPPELVTKMMNAFKSFSIEIKGKEATAKFGNMVVKGSLTEVSKSSGGATLKMIPYDEDKKNEPIMLVINGSKMTAGPENKPKEALYFVKK